MQKITLIFALLITSISCKTQQAKDSISEFGNTDNGLIYSSADMNALRFVVDSLNLRFKTCDLNKKFIACAQAALYTVTFKSKQNDLQNIIKSLKSNPSFDSLLNLYKEYVSNVDKEKIVIAYNVEDEKQQYLIGNAFSGFNLDYTLEGKPITTLNRWEYEYSKKDKYQDYYLLNCIFLPTSFGTQEIPLKYAQLIQYVDCMIDTTATIFLTDKYSGRFSSNEAQDERYKELLDYINKKLAVKESKEDYSYYWLSEEKLNYIKKIYATDNWLKDKIKSVIESSLENETSTQAVEDLAEAFDSKKTVLELKRHRRVMGQCSQDQSPRVHALNIAKLAAETHSWDIFLRSHLDIMNDRFERMSDGSYAWNQRKTYIKELEELNLNVIDMMIGLSLRAKNNSSNHYNGTIWRIGKALSESKDRLLFEEKALAIVKDEKLDNFNRSLIFMLYNSYLNFLPDKKEIELKRGELKKTISSYPVFIQSAIQRMGKEDQD